MSGLLHQESEVKNEYEKCRVIYRGTFSIVYLGRKKNTDIIPNLIIKTNEKQSIANEIEGLTRLRGEKHILQLLDIHLNPTGIVLERCLANLFSVLKNVSVFSKDERKCIAHQFLLGVNAIHDKELVHRDIKPQNVLVTFDGIVKIADFESMCENNTCPKNFIRTPGYSPPEVLIGDKNALQSVDLWAAGCVLFHIFAKLELFVPERDRAAELMTITSLFGCARGDYFRGLPDYSRYFDWAHRYQKNRFQHYLTSIIASGEERELTESLLQVDPASRTPVRELLAHEYFSSPLPLERISNVVEMYMEKTHTEKPEPFQVSNADSGAGKAQLPKLQDEQKLDEACVDVPHECEAQNSNLKEEEQIEEKEESSLTDDDESSASFQEKYEYTLSEWLKNVELNYSE